MSAYSELLDYYVERYNEGDLEAVMDLYAEDAVQLMPDGLFQGRDAIRDLLARAERVHWGPVDGGELRRAGRLVRGGVGLPE